jgi:hypothetical protein
VHLAVPDAATFEVVVAVGPGPAVAGVVPTTAAVTMASAAKDTTTSDLIFSNLILCTAHHPC